MADEKRSGPGATLKEDARFAGRESEDWKRTLGTFLGVWGAVILGSSTTLGLYAFGTDSWLTRGPILFAAVCIVVSFLLTSLAGFALFQVGRALLCLVLPPLAPYFGFFAGLRKWTYTWAGTFGAYVLSLLLALLSDGTGALW